MNPLRMELGRGDFLVRNLVGGDPDSGALAIGALVEETQVVQFQIRDGETAAEDLALGLSRYTAEHSGAVSALIFSCLGRGQGMYGRPNHDTDLLRRYLGDVSVSGFFCNGEIGPVEGRTFLHGYTSALGIFRPSS
jgi:small ligand-binding sensory domain FIST